MGHEKLVSMSLGTSESQNAQEINFSILKLYHDFYTRSLFQSWSEDYITCKNA